MNKKLVGNFREGRQREREKEQATSKPQQIRLGLTNCQPNYVKCTDEQDQLISYLLREWTFHLASVVPGQLEYQTVLKTVIYGVYQLRGEQYNGFDRRKLGYYQEQCAIYHSTRTSGCTPAASGILLLLVTLVTNDVVPEKVILRFFREDIPQFI